MLATPPAAFTISAWCWILPGQETLVRLFPRQLTDSIQPISGGKNLGNRGFTLENQKDVLLRKVNNHITS